jgi:hypothetical protein
MKRGDVGADTGFDFLLRFVILPYGLDSIGSYLIYSMGSSTMSPRPHCHVRCHPPHRHIHGHPQCDLQLNSLLVIIHLIIISIIIIIHDPYNSFPATHSMVIIHESPQLIPYLVDYDPYNLSPTSSTTVPTTYSLLVIHDPYNSILQLIPCSSSTMWPAIHSLPRQSTIPTTHYLLVSVGLWTVGLLVINPP